MSIAKPPIADLPGSRREALSQVERDGSAVSGGGDPASIVSKVAWIPRSEIDRHEWASAGRRLGAIGRCSQWWIGDWIRYGTSKWGERYVEASRITGYDVASLRNMAWVASQFDDLSLRSDKLTWSHHVLLAPLNRDEKAEWLARAIRERLSVSDLRLELRNASRMSMPASLSPPVAELPEASAGMVNLVCPECGHLLRVEPGR